MKVRDLRYKETEYKGHSIVAGAGGKNCPCLPCYNVHNCYGKDKVDFWDCATRFNGGCPEVLPRPKHIFKLTKRFENRKKGDKFRCVRCGQKLEIGTGEFDWITIEEVSK